MGKSKGRRATNANCEECESYADAVMTYLAFAIDKGADYWSSFCSWVPNGFIRSTFARQAIAMVWDYAECNPFSQSTGSWLACVDWILRFISKNSGLQVPNGHVTQLDALLHIWMFRLRLSRQIHPITITLDYADLSDFFLHLAASKFETYLPSSFLT